MKGIVFTEFQELVESTFGLPVYDQVLSETDLESGGIYTTVGTYDYGELLTMVTALSRITEMPVPALVRTFGGYLFTKFHSGYPQFFEGVDDPIEFLGSINDHIHVEVRKLYPDAELPDFAMEEIKSGKQWQLNYQSKRPFADLAEGLAGACLEHFGQDITMKRVDLAPTPEGIFRSRFDLFRGDALATASPGSADSASTEASS